MTFTPALPMGGLPGWAFLKRTMAVQQTAFAASAPLVRDADHFRDRIGTVRSAEALVGDRRLLSVALGAFGLEADLGNRFFIRKMLEEGTESRDALANRLTDRRYRDFVAAFGFGNDGGARTGQPGFADAILSDWRTRRFEAAVGTADNNLRLALNARRELARIAEGQGSEDARWFTIMGNPPLRQVMERALGLPSSLGRLDIDRQLDTFRARAATVLGDSSVRQFADPDRTERMVRLFLLRTDTGVSAASGAAAALQLLGQGGGLFRRIG